MRKPRRLFAAVVAAGLAWSQVWSVGPAVAQGPGSDARYDNGFGSQVRVDANYWSASGCGKVVDHYKGTPDRSRLRVGRGVMPLTIVVNLHQPPCGPPRAVRRVLTVDPHLDTITLRIYFVSASGEVLKVENVGIQ